MARCPCPTDPVPSAPCCPDTATLVNSIEGRDKDCNPRRIVPGVKGVLAAKNGKAGMMDGSSEKPIYTDIETFFAANGYVVIQDEGGRIVAIKPDTDLSANNAVLYFVYRDGAFKLVPFDPDNLFSDANVPASSSGKLALIACAGKDGKVKLGKFLPLPDGQEGGPWPLLIDSDNDVVVGEKGIDECDEVDSEDELDALSGCLGGLKANILPVVGKTLVGIAGPKWALKDDTSAIVSVARTSIYSRTHTVADIGASDSSDIDITTIIGYAAEYKFAMLHFVYRAQTSTSDMTHEVSVDGRRYVGINLIAGDFQGENNHNSAIVIIPDNKKWNVVNTRTFWQPGSANGNHWIEIYIDGWMK